MTADVRDLKIKGVQIVRGALPAEMVADLAARGQEVIEGVADGRLVREGQFANGLPDDWADAIIRSPEVLDLVEAALGPDLCLMTWRVLMKDHNFNGPIITHQDWPYYAGGGDKLNVFIPLTRVHRGNGGIAFLEGSHEFGPMERGIIDHEAFPELPETLPELEVGEILLADFMTWHYSVPATTTDQRIMIQAMFQPSSDPTSKDLVRGEIRNRQRLLVHRLDAMKEPQSLINAATAKGYLEKGEIDRAKGMALGVLAVDPLNVTAALILHDVLAQRGEERAAEYLGIAQNALNQLQAQVTERTPPAAQPLEAAALEAQSPPDRPQTDTPPPWTVGRVVRGVARRIGVA